MEMAMGNGNSTSGGAQSSHVLVFPFSVQGHMNPMVQFAKRLASKGLKVTVVTTIKAIHRFQLQAAGRRRLSSFEFDLELISDGSESTDPDRPSRVTAMTKSLADLITRIKDKRSYPELKFLVYHSAMPWALDIARQHGLDGAPFFTNSSSVVAIYDHFRQGAFKIPTEFEFEENDYRSTMILSLPSMPPLGLADLPSFVSDVDSYPAYLEVTLSQFSNIGGLKWLFICTFDKLEEEVLEWMRKQEWPVRTIGPTVPSMFLDKRLEDDKDYSLNMFKPNVESCMEWLDSRETGSVVYASFGSMANLEKEQIEELAWGLRDMKYNFLWAVRESEMEKLPGSFLEETSTCDKGLVVSWCSQLQVLAHRAVRCFVSHCGWNSVMEALSLGVPMVTMPNWADQATNAKFVADVWKVGVRVGKDDKGIARKEEIAKCIDQVMDMDPDEETGMKMRKASLRWRQLAKEAVDQGGSSDNNIEEFVAQLKL